MEFVDYFNNILKSFNIGANCIDFKQMEGYSYYDLKLRTPTRVKDLQSYSDEISLALKMTGKPSIKILHDLGVVRLEFITKRNFKLQLFDIFNNQNIPSGKINCLLGKMVDGSEMWIDLSQNPHMLVAGTTGSGKSTLLHNIIANLINYNDVDLYLVDPKRIEFTEYKKSFHDMNVYHSYNEVLDMLRAALDVMEFRYDMIRSGIVAAAIKPVVIIIDEFADLILQDKNNEFYLVLCQLAQKCRAANIHIILATQRPSVNVISGTIKANFPARIACKTASSIDSKIILDVGGAENLLGKGDALIKDNGHFLDRFQIAYTDATEVCSIFGKNATY